MKETFTYLSIKKKILHQTKEIWNAIYVQASLEFNAEMPENRISKQYKTATFHQQLSLAQMLLSRYWGR